MLRPCLFIVLLLVLTGCASNSVPDTPATPTVPERDAPDPNFPEGEAPDSGTPDTIPDADPPEPGEASLCSTQTPEANTVYISPYGNDEADGHSPATAWRNMSRLQSELDKLRAGEQSVLGPGGQILLERGGVYYGYLSFNDLSGSAPEPFRIGAFCEGDDPVLSGYQPLSAWRPAGNNVWEVDCPGCGARPNALRLDGEMQILARWPNPEGGDEEGYNYYDDFTNTPYSVSDAALNGQNWTGGEAVVKPWPWVMDRLYIESQVGNTLNLRGVEGRLPSSPLQKGYGYFIQNHPAALDRHGEWVYDADKNTIQLYLSSGSPTNHRVEISRMHTLLSVDASNYLELEDVVLEGAHELAIWGRSCQGLSLRNVTLRDLGGRGLHLDDCADVTVTDSQILNTQDNGVYLANCTNCKVAESVFDNIAMAKGMGGDGDLRYLGVLIGGQGSLFEYNRVTRNGYIPVTAQSYATVRHNFIDDFSSVKVDGAGIYTFEATGVTIEKNIVTNGRGSTAGIPWSSTVTNGVYTDQRTRDTLVKDNTFAYTSGSGIKVFSGQNIRFENNTVFAARERGLEFLEKRDTIFHSDLLVQNNLFVLERPGDPVVRMNTDGGEERMAAAGVLTQNTYCTPLTLPQVSRSYVADGQRINYREEAISFAAWQAYQDKDSRPCPYSYPSFEVSAVLTPNLVANGDFGQDASAWSRWPVETKYVRTEAGQLEVTAPGELLTDVGPVEAGSVYRLRFDASGPANAAALRLRLHRSGPTYEAISPLEVIPLSTELSPAEVFIVPTADVENVRLRFLFAGEDLPATLDNVEFVKVDAAATNLSDKVRLEINPSETVRSVVLDGVYLDVKGQRYSGSVSVPPYGSVVLFKEP